MERSGIASVHAVVRLQYMFTRFLSPRKCLSVALPSIREMVALVNGNVLDAPRFRNAFCRRMSLIVYLLVEIRQPIEDT